MTRADITRFVHAVRDSYEAAVDDAVTRLSRVRPWLAPLAFAVGAFAMLFDGVRRLPQDQWDAQFGTGDAADGWEELAAMPCRIPGDAWRPSAPTRGREPGPTASTGSGAT